MGINWAESLAAKLPAAKEPDDLIYRMRTSALYRALHFGLKRYVAPAFFAFVFVYIGLALANHALYNVQDYAGWVCKKTQPARELAPGEKVTLATFKTSEVCQDMGVALEQYARYQITIKPIVPFRDGSIDASKGIYFNDPPWLYQKLLLAAAVPIRRELTRPWFRIVARYGSPGGEETFLDPDLDSKDGAISETIKVTQPGQLFLFVNDAVLAVPSLYGYFYRNNEGTAEVTITREKACFVCTAN